MAFTAMSLTNRTLTVVIDSGKEILTARNDHPHWNDILIAFRANDEKALRNLLSMKAVVANYTNDDITVDGTGVIYRGHPMHGVDSDRVLAFLKEGLPYAPIANYMARKMKNPSARAITEMYNFLEHRSMPLTPEGKIIAYKGVQEDFYSINGNKETVVIQGKVNEKGQILNEIGVTIEVERSSVDDNYQVGCSFGLHAGSLSYAKNWGSKVILVEIDPADVVSVPSDCNCEKLRCCKYKVIGEYTGPLPDTYTSEFSKEKEDSKTCDKCGETIKNCDCDFSADDDNPMPRYSSSPSNAKLADEILGQEIPGFAGVESNDSTELKKVTSPRINNLEQVAQDAGILDHGPDSKELVAGGMPGDINNYEKDYLAGMKKGIEDRALDKPPQYLAGDQVGADSPRHAQFIDGYINGYK